MKKHFRTVLLLGAVVLPFTLKRWVYTRILDADIAPDAKIGLSFIDVQKLKMGSEAQIGHFNVIRGLALLDMGDYSTILKQNTITAIPVSPSGQFSDEKDRVPALILGTHSAIVSKHFLDCNNTITIGHHTTIAGLGSAFFTHAINIEKNKQESAPITIGNYAMIGAMCCVLKGTVLADGAIVAANSTLRGTLDKPYALYSGVPALHIKDLDRQSGYFTRAVGYVD